MRFGSLRTRLGLLFNHIVPMAHNPMCSTKLPMEPPVPSKRDGDMIPTEGTKKVLQVDLQLPKDKLPTAIGDWPFEQLPELIHNYAIGSSKPDEKIIDCSSYGLFGCIRRTWEYHWNLRYVPMQLKRVSL